MLGYGPEDKSAVLELTYNYGVTEYEKGNAYAQVKVNLCHHCPLLPVEIGFAVVFMILINFMLVISCGKRKINMFILWDLGD